ncbi:MAG: hypothetical protein ABIK90_02060 [candidate division WOR-3 bacterium]
MKVKELIFLVLPVERLLQVNKRKFLECKASMLFWILVIFPLVFLEFLLQKNGIFLSLFLSIILAQFRNL